MEERTLLSGFVVSNTGDSGPGSLRQAILDANAQSGASDITFDPTAFATPQTISLTSGQLELSETTGTETITGPAAGLTISGGKQSRVFQVDQGVTASISGLTITGGGNASAGGGLFNLGTTTLTDCTVRGNSAGNDGGGVYNNGTVSGNSAYGGGGMFNGGGGTATLTDCTVSGNSASYGGGVYNDRGGTATLINCTISGNSAGNGGGLYAVGGTSTLTNCTVSDNSARIGSGVWNGASDSATLTNCTVSGNSADNPFGALYNYGTATLTNTIVAGNSGGDFWGRVPYSGSHDLVGGDPLLAPLGNYGGPTQTMALLPGSPAIGAGIAADYPGTSTPITTDQRGEPLAALPDIGAFQSQGFTLTPVAGSTPQTSPIGTPFANPLAVTVTANNPIEPVNGGFLSFVTNRVGGAAAILSAPSAVIAGGQAALTAGPDNALGSYIVVASAGGASSVSFALTNTGSMFPSLVVNTTSDSLFPGTGLLSLPEAVAFANLVDSAGLATITFNQQVFAMPQTITLTGTQLELSNTSEAETITGPAAGLTISGGKQSRVFQVDQGVTASISGLTITGGGNASAGGGLFNLGTTTLTDCTVRGNSASYGGGGASTGGGTLTLTNCTVSGNSAGHLGGGVYTDTGGTATLINCTISNNSAGSEGGGLDVARGAITLINCTVSGNFALTNGGGVYINNGGTTTLANCTITGNWASDGGGLNNQGTATLNGCTISNNAAATGGGLQSSRGTLDADQLHRQRQPRRRQWRRPVPRHQILWLSWHGHADQLHRQRQLCL